MGDGSAYISLVTAAIGLLSASVANFDMLSKAFKKTRKRFPQIIHIPEEFHKSRVKKNPPERYLDTVEALTSACTLHDVEIVAPSNFNRLVAS